MTVAHPDDRFASVGGGMRICYRTHGDASDPTVLLVAGLGQHLIAWPEAFCQALVEEGFHVVRFDNRDIGRSSQGRAPAPKTIHLATRRGFHAAQYSLDDMTLDTAGLIESLETGPVHVVGMSMGGMIAQQLAARHPEHVASLTSIMSMTGARTSGQPALSTWLRMAGPPSRDRTGYVRDLVGITRHIGSRGFPFDEAGVSTIAGEQWDRGHARQHEGVTRQLAAIMKSGDRTRALAAIKAPTLVIHGDRDPMVNPSGGAATAAAIPGARLETIAGMGHDLPAGALTSLTQLITGHARSAVGAVAA